jgi:cytochrome c biogenesis protein CcmG, thiol:disulfide interchange protein DsbE
MMETIQPGRFKGLLFLAAGLLVGVILAAVVLFAATPGGALSAPPPATGKPIPEFGLKTLQGAALSPEDFKGHPVVINFWATWCGPCQEEMPLFERMSRRLEGKVFFLAVNDNETLPVVSAFAQTHGLSFPIGLDPGGTITTRFYVESYPTTFFIDAEGILRAQHIGQLDEDLMVRYLEAAGITP